MTSNALATGWLSPTALRVGLGCMRLWTGDTDGSGDATVAAAVDGGITIFDTARTYDGPGGAAGGNERRLTELLRACGGDRSARIVTKGGMRRVGASWIPDGRARSILSDCAVSLAALDGIPISLYLLHAPDPTRPLRTSLRALARLLDEGLVEHVGLSNVSRVQLEEATAVLPISAVEVALSPLDDARLRDGTVAVCAERGITVIAHSPLGGPRRRRALQRNERLRAAAEHHEASVEEVALAWVLGLGANVVAIPGARRPASARSAARSAQLRLDGDTQEALGEALGRPRAARVAAPRARGEGDVVLVMGIPGAGKSRGAQEYIDRGYARLNRDLRGGSLRALCAALDELLAHDTRAVVLDNTWLTRAARSDAIEVASRHGVAIRCLWLDVTLADAQRNVVERLLMRDEALPTPDEVRQFNGRDGMISPTAQMRALRQLEPPSIDEGFSSVERVEFTRVAAEPTGTPGVFIAAPAVARHGIAQLLGGDRQERPHLVFDWQPDGTTGPLDHAVARVRDMVPGPVSGSLCPHPAGPPVCWCRPHLLGLVLQFARRHQVDPACSLLIGTSATHRSMAGTLGSRYIES